MKLTVTKYLNVRVGKPSLNAPCYQYLAPGSEIEVEDQLFQGDKYDGINKWYRDEANNYYWSGGLYTPNPKEGTSLAILPFDKSRFWWLYDFGIIDIWALGLSGKGIKVAVLDSGLSLPHPDLIIDLSKTKDFTGSSSGIQDQVGHGTHITGIIKGSNNGFGVTGIAYNAELFFGKITHDIFGDNIKYLTDGINWAINENVDIISISMGFITSSTELEKAIIKAINHKILVVCAAGNMDGTNGPDILYPARFSKAGVISVGGLTKTIQPLSDTINVSQTEVFAPGDQILSTHLYSTYLHRPGSSQATPFVAGVACLALEAKRKAIPAYQAIDLKNEILLNADPMHPFKVINPIKLIP
jgi:subtilisin family serine protease